MLNNLTADLLSLSPWTRLVSSAAGAGLQLVHGDSSGRQNPRRGRSPRPRMPGGGLLGSLFGRADPVEAPLAPSSIWGPEDVGELESRPSDRPHPHGAGWMKGIFIPLSSECRSHIAHWDRHQAEWEALLDVQATVKSEIVRHQRLYEQRDRLQSRAQQGQIAEKEGDGEEGVEQREPEHMDSHPAEMLDDEPPTIPTVAAEDEEKEQEGDDETDQEEDEGSRDDPVLTRSAGSSRQRAGARKRRAPQSLAGMRKRAKQRGGDSAPSPPPSPPGSQEQDVGAVLDFDGVAAEEEGQEQRGSPVGPAGLRLLELDLFQEAVTVEASIELELDGWVVRSGAGGQVYNFPPGALHISTAPDPSSLLSALVVVPSLPSDFDSIAVSRAHRAPADGGRPCHRLDWREAEGEHPGTEESRGCRRQEEGGLQRGRRFNLLSTSSPLTRCPMIASRQ